MKKYLLFVLAVIFQGEAFSQTLVWANMSTGSSYPRTVPYGGGQTATVYYSSSATTPSTPPNDVMLFKSGTNQADLWACGSHYYASNTLPGSTPGLIIANNFTSTAEATAGNYLHVTFSTPVCGLNFNLVDLTSPALSDNFPVTGQGVYNDMVTVTATDISGGNLTATLTEIGNGYSSGWTSSCSVAKIWHPNVPMPGTPAATARNITDNTAYVTGGSYNNNSNPPASACGSGGFLNSMDINVSITGCVKKLIIRYYNHPTYLALRNAGGTCNPPVIDNGNASPQGILIGTLNYSSILPLELISFYGREKDNKILLNWQTANEINTQGFDILHSTDGINFNSVGYVPALNVHSGGNYEFEHQSAFSGNNYYKLLQSDIDGHETYSNIIQINNSKHNFTIIPNPVYDKLTIQGLPSDEISGISIKNLNGLNLGTWTQPSEIDVSNLTSGFYFLEVFDKNEAQIYKSRFIKI